MSSDVDSMDDVVETQPSTRNEEEIRRRAATLAKLKGIYSRQAPWMTLWISFPTQNLKANFIPLQKYRRLLSEPRSMPRTILAKSYPDSLAVDFTEEPLAEIRIDLRREEEEEEEEDSSDDLPLALKTVIKDKGKGRADVTPAPKVSPCPSIEKNTDSLSRDLWATIHTKH